MNDWQIFDSVLLEKNVPRQVMIYPERYMDQFNVTRRRCAIKLMEKRGMSLDQLEACTPFTRRYLREIVASKGVEPELNLGDNALSLRDEKEAQPAMISTGPIEQP